MTARNQTLAEAKSRVLIVAHDVDDTGGTERVAADLVRALAGEYPVTVISVTLAASLRNLVEWKQVRLLRHPVPIKLIGFYFLAGLKVWRTKKDITHTIGATIPNRVTFSSAVHCHTAAAREIGGLAPRAAPFTRRMNTRLTNWLALHMERWSYRPSRLASVLVATPAIEAAIREQYGAPTVRVAHGVDLNKFRPNLETRRATREAYSVGDNTVVLFVGGDWDRKGLAVAIKSVASARSHGAQVILWVVGKGDQPRFKRMADTMGVLRYATFFGTSESVVPFYQAADIFILPSSYEAFGLVMLEAASSALPLVVRPVGIASTLVAQNEGGILVPGGTEEFAAALTTLAFDAPARLIKGHFAQAQATQFSSRTVTEEVLRLYRGLEKPRPFTPSRAVT